MRWDDLQLLRMIDELEQTNQIASLWSGLAVMQTAAAAAGVSVGSGDITTFAHELMLAHESGFLTWTDQQAGTAFGSNPRLQSEAWLQQVTEIRLTSAGRDRARGRVIQGPLPDPEEDDGRPITGMTLEEVARAIADVYTATQLPIYLRDSGISEASIPLLANESKWEYVFGVLEELSEGGSAGRRTLREFIGGWLEGRYHVPPQPNVRARVVAILAQQGWHVHDGRLVIGERTFDATGVLTPIGRDLRIASLHADIRQVAARYLESGHLEVAIFEAFKAVNNRVKAMTALELDGSSLMGRAFADTNPSIALADLSSDTGRNVQAGYRFLFMGAAQGIRNPDAHEQFATPDDAEALEKLGLASMLMRRLDQARIAN